MENAKTLNILKVNETAIIEAVNCSESIKRRLLDLGLIKGTVIKILYKSPFGDPSAYLIRGAVIALRNDDTQHIIIK